VDQYVVHSQFLLFIFYRNAHPKMAVLMSIVGKRLNYLSHFALLPMAAFVMLTVILCLVADSARTAWAAFACLMSVTYALVGVSGSHFNPAVSLGMLVSGRTKLSFLDGMAYCASQFCAAALAGIVVGACGQVGGSLDEQPVPGVIMGVWQGSGTSMPWSTYVAAFVFTGVLVLVVSHLQLQGNHHWRNSFKALQPLAAWLRPQ